jgi:hypothetical protein
MLRREGRFYMNCYKYVGTTLNCDKIVSLETVHETAVA